MKPLKNIGSLALAGMLCLLPFGGAFAQKNKDTVRAPKDASANPNQFGGKSKKRKGTEKAKLTNEYLESRKKGMVKEEREKSKPQYTDASYFGHKKPPKKRPRGKQKMCKECGMKH